MTFDLARPRYTLPLAGKEYELIGNMALVESIEYQLKKGIGFVAIEVAGDMPTLDLAKLLSAVLSASGHPMTVPEAKDLLWDTVGLAGEANSMLRLHLYSFLSICLAPPEAREKKAKEMAEMTGKLQPASRGKSTRKSA